jgi:site-specific DNA recombinase
MVKQSAETKGENGIWERRRARYLLSGLARCGLCGGGFSMISATHLGCSTARNKGSCSSRTAIKRTELEARVLGALKSKLMDPERGLSRFRPNPLRSQRRLCGYLT